MMINWKIEIKRTNRHFQLLLPCKSKMKKLRDEEIACTRQSLIAARPNWKIFAPD